MVSLATRPVLFTLARALAEAWPADVSREKLIARAFRGKEADVLRKRLDDPDTRKEIERVARELNR